MQAMYPGGIRLQQADLKYDCGFLMVLLAVEQKMVLQRVLQKCKCSHWDVQTLLDELDAAADW